MIIVRTVQQEQGTAINENNVIEFRCDKCMKVLEFDSRKNVKISVTSIIGSKLASYGSWQAKELCDSCLVELLQLLHNNGYELRK